MKRIKELEIEGEKVYLNKGFFGWRVVYPWKKEYNSGKINWKHLIAGRSWFNLVIVIGFVLLILGAIREYYTIVKISSACLRALPDSINLNIFIDNPNLVNNFSNILGGGLG